MLSFGVNHLFMAISSMDEIKTCKILCLFPTFHKFTGGYLWNNYVLFELLNHLQREKADSKKLTLSLADTLNDDVHRGFPGSVYKEDFQCKEYLTNTVKCSYVSLCELRRFISSTLEAWAYTQHNPFHLISHWSLLSEFGDGGLSIIKKGKVKIVSLVLMRSQGSLSSWDCGGRFESDSLWLHM